MATNIAMFSDRRSAAWGYLAALTAVFITSVYPALTRLSVTTTLTPADLLLFRLGVSGLLFTPFLVMHAHEISKADWLASLPLSFLHGWGMAACVVFGLQFAPASHAAALGPGAIAAWIALVGFVAYGIHVHSRKLAGISIIVIGVGLVLFASYRGLSVSTAMIGDSMFLLASALGASYLVYIQRRRLNPLVAAALVCVASAMIVVPWHYSFASSAIATAPVQEIVWQLLFQGVLVGCCAFLALNYATLAIGSQTVGVLSALVPVVGALCSMLITRDSISSLEWIAIVVISLGVAIASFPVRPPSRERDSDCSAEDRVTRWTNRSQAKPVEGTKAARHLEALLRDQRRQHRHSASQPKETNMNALAFANDDIALVAWSYDERIAGCLGFAIYRIDVAAGTQVCLPALATFPGQAATPGRTTEVDPVQKCFAPQWIVTQPKG